MEVRFVTRNVEVPEGLKDQMENKLQKVQKFFDKIMDVQVTVEYKRGMNIVEITANVGGLVMRGEDYAPDMRKSFDKALKNIERQVKRHKDYLKDRSHLKTHDISFGIEPEAFSLEEEEPSRDIVKVKRFPVSVMLPEEATRQMDLLGHSFFMFRNGDTGTFNVVYRRREGGYGLLEPE